ncbi:hypothetical protein BC828DRAFT_390019 [Blastocladiella britannica]|nr:hypothetical protein BC828DRAFT_390019 [Blastocladiella britannica]
MSVTSRVFFWDSTSFFAGANIALDLWTCLTALQLCRSTAWRSKFYLGLATVALAHVFDFALSLYPTSDGEDGTVGMWLTLVTLVCAAWDGAGFTIINFMSFWSVGASRMYWPARILLGLSAISIVVCVVNNLVYVIGVVRYAHDSGDMTLSDIGDSVFLVWAIADAFINAAISISFIMVLKKVGAGPNSTDAMRRRYGRFLAKVQINQFFQSVLVVVANLLLRLTTIDPNWLGIYCAESLRMRLYLAFLFRLNGMLKGKDGSESTTGNGGNSIFRDTLSFNGSGAASNRAVHNTSGGALESVGKASEASSINRGGTSSGTGGLMSKVPAVATARLLLAVPGARSHTASRTGSTN